MRRLFTANGKGRIQRPSQASPVIGQGGNYLQGPTNLRGKVEGSGLPPTIRRDRNGNRFIHFATTSAQAPGNDRTELAHTTYIPLNRDVLIEWSMRFPKGAPRSSAFFTPLQLWQCSPRPPIAGPRVRPGTATTIDFAPLGGSFTMRPGRWHNFSMRVSSRSMTVYVDRRSLGTRYGTIGLPSGACHGPGAEAYRVKFGIYRSDSPQAFQVDFDNISVSY